MPALLTQQSAREVRDLPFCYLCGHEFVLGDRKNHDHVPPKSIFLPDDRDFPLKLATHVDCNTREADDDEFIGQLISVFHGKWPPEGTSKIELEAEYNPQADAVDVFLRTDRFDPFVKRCLKGFHAALYREAMPDETKFAIQIPFPTGKLLNGVVIQDPVPPQHLAFVETVKKNRVSRTLDAIVTCNAKMQYECVWDKLSDHSWACVFALDVYGWHNFGRQGEPFPLGCAGLYRLPEGNRPSSATASTSLEFPLANLEPANPFGE